MRNVKVHVYDLSHGLARSLSMALLGKQIDGVWHTGIVIGGVEHFFGQGIQCCPANQSPFGQPASILSLGETEVSDEMLDEFLEDLKPRFNAATYDLLKNNCNHFSDELAQLLVGTGIPAHIVSLPEEVMNTPFGRSMLPMLQPHLQDTLGNATATGFGSAPAASGSAAPSHAREDPAEAIANAVDEATHTHIAHDLQHPGPEQAAQSEAKRAAEASARAAAAVKQLSLDVDTVEAAAAAKASFQDALRIEFDRVKGEGEADANRAAAEAMKRVMVAVRAGTVTAPPQPKAVGVK